MGEGHGRQGGQSARPRPAREEKEKRMAKKQLSEVEKQIIEKQHALLEPYESMTDSGAASNAAADLAIALGMPASAKAAFVALAAPFGFLGNSSQWSQKWADYKGEARPSRKAADVDANALAAAMAALNGPATPPTA